MLLEQQPSHRWVMDSKRCGRRRSRSVPMHYSVIGLMGRRGPRSLCQGVQCRDLAACRLDFVTCCCRPWLPYATNVKSTSAVVFFLSACLLLSSPLFVFTCRMFVLTQMVLCHLCYLILYVLFYPWIESITTESDILV
jgi:hypothetical protein